MTERTGPSAATKGSNRVTASLLLGLLLVPASAVAAFALVSPSEPAGDEAAAVAPAAGVMDTTQYASSTQSSSESVVVVEPASATRGDLEAACGADGRALVEREHAGVITPLEQAALDALRQICETEGLLLAGPPAPPDVIKTVRVKSPPSALAAAASSGESSSESHSGDEDGSREHEEDDDDDEREASSAEEYRSEHAAASSAIDKAVAEGGDQEKIQEARDKIGRAEQKAAQGDYTEATSNAREARKKAEEAIGDGDDD